MRVVLRGWVGIYEDYGDGRRVVRWGEGYIREKVED